MEYHVEVRAQDPVRVARSRFVTSMAEVCQDMGRGYRELWQSLERGKVQVTGDYALAVYPDPAFDPHRFTVEVAFEVGPDATAGEGFEVAEHGEQYGPENVGMMPEAEIHDGWRAAAEAHSHAKPMLIGTEAEFPAPSFAEEPECAVFAVGFWLGRITKR